MSSIKNLSEHETESIIEVLKSRIENSQDRLGNLNWTALRSKLEQQLDKLWSLHEMEK